MYCMSCFFIDDVVRLLFNVKVCLSCVFYNKLIYLLRCIKHKESASDVRHTESSTASRSVWRDDWRSTGSILPTNLASSKHI